MQLQRSLRGAWPSQPASQPAATVSERTSQHFRKACHSQLCPEPLAGKHYDAGMCSRHLCPFFTSHSHVHASYCPPSHTHLLPLSCIGASRHAFTRPLSHSPVLNHTPTHLLQVGGDRGLLRDVGGKRGHTFNLEAHGAVGA